MSAFRILNAPGPQADVRDHASANCASSELTGKKYWRSLDHVADTPKFREWVEREFPAGASELLTGSSRRNILKLMAASFGFAGLAACRRPVTNILPHAKNIEEYVHGQSLYYATAMSIAGEATGLLVEAHEGRPTKIEGNPEHPFSLGAASAWHQASVLSLYDPDRSQSVRNGDRRASWDDFVAFAKFHFDPAKVGQGNGIRVLSQRADSPSLSALRRAFLQKFPNAKWIEYEPFASTAAAEGAALAFGEPVQAHPQFNKADVIVSLDSDFLGIDSGSVLPLKAFSMRRRITSPKDEMNRLYVVESQYSVTGGQADHRLRMRTGDVKRFAADLARELGLLGDGLNVVPAHTDKRRKFLVALARDMKAHAGRCLVVAGPRQPKEVHAMAHALNHAFGSPGETVKYTAAPERSTLRSLADLRELAGDLSRGAVNTVVVLGGNPAFDGPADLYLETNLKKAAVSIYVGPENNETAATAKWHIPEAHFLESWGDVAASDGTVSIQQPLIEPLFGGKTKAEVLAVVTGYRDERAYDIVRNYWLDQFTGDKEKAWRKAVHDGVVANTTVAEIKPSTDIKRAAALFTQTDPRDENNLEVTFFPSAKVYDGRFANNAWLQETPEPMTKLTWDNAALISPATAKALNVTTGDMVSLKRGDRIIEIPVMIQPGHADGAVSLQAGFGRKRCGRVGLNVGHDVYPLRTSEAMGFAGGATLTRTLNTYELVTTQEHHTIDDSRPIVRDVSLKALRENPKVIAEMDDPHPPLLSLHREFDYTRGQQWGMAIDLTACIGCNACVLACQAENNIPVVGKEEVARGREMNWIRMDRYYAGDMEDPESVMEPVVCMQCENAPCESVCPVAATTHSPEGLNDMAYNRCVGTRYCSNNCPYKVRRFNFFNWHKDISEVEKMAFNPDVTVRMRGVMEKCTYCVQRIQDARVRAKADGRRAIKDGEVTPACAQTCAAEAIVFGNINDPESRVSKVKAQERNYVMLGELNTKPRTSYLAKIRNPNPELA